MIMFFYSLCSHACVSTFVNGFLCLLTYFFVCIHDLLLSNVSDNSAITYWSNANFHRHKLVLLSKRSSNRRYRRSAFAMNYSHADIPSPELAFHASVDSPTEPPASTSVWRTLYDKVNTFFTFDTQGKFRAWPIALIVLFVTATAVSTGAIVYRSMQLSSQGSSATLHALNAAHCPWISTPQLPVAFTAWRSNCTMATTGHAYACSSTASCAEMSTDCAPLTILAQLECVGSDGTVIAAPPSANESNTPTDGTKQAPTQANDGKEEPGLGVSRPQQPMHTAEHRNAQNVDDVVTRHVAYCALRPNDESLTKEKIVHGFCTSPRTHCALCVRGDCSEGAVKCLEATSCSATDVSNPWSCAIQS